MKFVHTVMHVHPFDELLDALEQVLERIPEVDAVLGVDYLLDQDLSSEAVIDELYVAAREAGKAIRGTGQGFIRFLYGSEPDGFSIGHVTPGGWDLTFFYGTLEGNQVARWHAVVQYTLETTDPMEYTVNERFQQFMDDTGWSTMVETMLTPPNFGNFGMGGPQDGGPNEGPGGDSDVTPGGINFGW